MAKWALYHDFDPFKCEVVREAIKAGAVADGEVICGDIKELTAGDVRRFRQFHAFCGGAFWSLALRQAGWDDSRPVWTGSCPCPSFSAAGKGEGFADARHLWPEWYRLIRECRPSVVFGEQVAAAIGHGWLDLVCGNLEAEGYAVAAAVLGAHSAGAPHIRQRLYLVAQSSGKRWERGQGTTDGSIPNGTDAGWLQSHDGPTCTNQVSGSVDHAAGPRRDGAVEGTEGDSRDGERLRLSGDGCPDGILADATQPGLGIIGRRGIAFTRDSWTYLDLDHQGSRPNPLNGFWRDADWIGCRDGKWRPVKPGTFPLAYGYPARVGLLRLAGDAICVPAVQAFIESYLETERQ